MNPLAIPLTSKATLLGAAEESLFLIELDAFPLLLDAKNVRFSSLNALGKEALPKLLQSGLDATVSQLAQRFPVDAATLRRDLRAFAGNLEQQGFLPVAGQRRSLGTRLRRGLFERLARFTLACKTRRFLRRAAGQRRPEKELRRLVSELLRWAWLSLRVLGWADTLRLWRDVQATPGQTVPASGLEHVIALVDQVVRDEAAGQLLFVCACKERALVASYCLGQLFGCAADVVFGVIPVPFQVHAWSVCGGQALTDDLERIGMFQPVMRFPL